jgi:hypothetical protein
MRNIHRYFPLGILLGSLATGLGQIDSGGGLRSIAAASNHSTIGAPFATSEITSGLIEVLYPHIELDPSLDVDSDGLLDSWEMQFFGSTSAAPDADSDGDGTTNLMEYLAGTNPLSAASRFQPECREENGKLIVTVPTAIGRQYKVWGSANLQIWELLETLTGDGSPIAWEYLMSQSPSGRYFLKIEILLP